MESIDNVVREDISEKLLTEYSSERREGGNPTNVWWENWSRKRYNNLEV
jgi:hypothetical protein